MDPGWRRPGGLLLELPQLRMAQRVRGHRRANTLAEDERRAAPTRADELVSLR
jgi:hypothetical protein